MTIEEIRASLADQGVANVTEIIDAIVAIRSEAYNLGWNDAEDE